MFLHHVRSGAVEGRETANWGERVKKTGEEEAEKGSNRTYLRSRLRKKGKEEGKGRKEGGEMWAKNPHQPREMRIVPLSTPRRAILVFFFASRFERRRALKLNYSFINITEKKKMYLSVRLLDAGTALNILNITARPWQIYTPSPCERTADGARAEL